MSLVEVMIAIAIVAIIFLANMQLIQMHNLQARRSMEESIVMDFAQHYLELARNQPFNRIMVGQPINTLCDGTHGTPDIRFPSNGDWQDLTNTNYLTFHPDLAWLQSQSPQYRCVIATQTVGSINRSRHIEFEVRWHPALRNTQDWLSLQLDTLVYFDFN